MPKNIILCSDGTRNKGGVGHPTNIWKLFTSIDLQKYKHSDSVEQVAFYDDGVGTDRLKLLKIIGGAFGLGLTRNVKELYTHLVRNYVAGDHIYLFGFSRGAFTIRTLAGLVNRCGVIDKKYWVEKGESELKRLVDEAYECYRKGYERRCFDLFQALVLRIKAYLKKAPPPKVPGGPEVFRRLYGVDCNVENYGEVYQNLDFNSVKLKSKKIVPLRFIGVWDTVDAVGLPFRRVTQWWNDKVYHFKFPDTELAPTVNKACHVLSIDDERKTFHPTLFDESKERNIPASGQAPRIEQVWFPGVHSNVGGGYPKQGMADVTLEWMVRKAQDQGLVFEFCALKEIQCSRNVHDKLYDSRSGPAFFYRYEPRDIAEICAGKMRKIRIHVGTFQRIARHTDGYAPINLPAEKFEIVSAPSLFKDKPNRVEDPEALKEQVRHLEEKLSDPHFMATVSDIKEKMVKQRIYCHLAAIYTTLVMVGVGLGFKFWSVITESPIITPDFAWVKSLENILKGLFGAIPIVGDLFFKGVLQPLLAMPVLAVLCLVTILLAYGIDSRIKKQINDRMGSVWGQALEGPWWSNRDIPQAEDNGPGDERPDESPLCRVCPWR